MKMNAAGHIRHYAGCTPDKTAFIEGVRKVTYRQLDKQVDAMANLLFDRGVRPKERIALLAPSGIDWVICYMGIVRLGATAAPLNWKLTPDEIQSSIELVEAALVVVHPDFNDTFGAQIPEEKKLVLGGSGERSLDTVLHPCRSKFGGDFEDENGTQVILFTGGTTGRQKGVMLSHQQLFLNTIQMVVDTEISVDDVTVILVPLHHAGGLVIWLLPHLYMGATSVILPDYSPERLLNAIENEGVTNGWTPPSVTRDLLTYPDIKNRNLSSFRRWYVAGGPFPRSDRAAMKELIPTVNIVYQYGLTEAGVMVTVLKDREYERAPDSIGRPFHHCEVKILRENLEDADVDEVGEIAVRSPSVMQGYYNQPDATADAFHDGWLRTGDMGRVDQNGYIYFHDRLKDMVKTGGFNVYSQEVERVLLRHPAVREGAVFGLPSERWGEEVVAAVVLRDGAAASADDILGYLKQTLSAYKVPKQLHFLSYSDMPINYSGKIMKKELRERFKAAAFS